MKIMLIGPSAAGKTTLIQRLIDEEIKYDKTQAVEYIGNFIDTPGEYMQQSQGRLFPNGKVNKVRLT